MYVFLSVYGVCAGVRACVRKGGWGAISEVLVEFNV